MDSGPEDSGSLPGDDGLGRGLRAVVSAADELLACPDLDTLCRRAVELARQRLGIERCALMLRDGPSMRGTYGTDTSGRTVDETGFSESFDRLWADEVTPPTQDGPRWRAAGSALREWDGEQYRIIGEGVVATTHIWHNGEYLGVLWNDNAISGGGLVPRQQEVLAAYVSFLGPLIARKREEQSQERLMRGALDAVKELMLCADTDTLHRAAVELARERLGLERCALFVVEEGVIRGAYGTDMEGRTTDERTLWYARDEGWERVLEDHPEGGPEWDLQRETLLTSWDAGSVAKVGHGWVARNVLSAGSGPIAVFFNDAAISGTAPDPVQQWVVSVYCSTLAGLLQRMRAEETRMRMAEGLAEVVQAARELTECREPEELYRRAVELARERLGLERCGLLLYDGAVLRGTFGTDERGETTDERERVVDVVGAWQKALRVPRPGERGYRIEYTTDGQVDGEGRVVGLHAWVALTTLATTNRVIGGFSNDAAIGGSPPDEVQQQVVAVYCSVLAGLIEQKRAESELRQSQQRFRALIENSNDVIMVFGADGEATYVSPSVTRIVGWATEDLIGQQMGSLVHPEDRPRLAEAFARRMSGAASTGPVEFRCLHREGHCVDIEAFGTPAPPDGPLQGLIVTARDVGDRKRLEHQLRQASKLEAVGTLAGGIAHDFNNILTGILGLSELLQPRASDERSARGLKSIQQLGERGAALVRQLLVFTRGQGGRPAPVDLNLVISNMALLLRQGLGEDITQELDLAPDLVTVSADMSQLEQVLMNLAVNARDAMSAGGTLRIATRNALVEPGPGAEGLRLRPGTYACLSVIDSGCGMDQATLDRVFEPFFTTKAVGEGTGLGLATVYGIVRQHGGAVTVTSSPGAGTTVEVYLPMTTEAPAQSEATERELTQFRGTETILLVEDEPQVLELVCSVLQEQGYRVLPAASPFEALSIFSAHESRIDLLLTDLVMPGMTGVELHRAIARQRSGLRVLFMSGYADHPAIDQSPQAAGYPFLAKPFGPADLAAKIREVIDAEPAG